MFVYLDDEKTLKRNIFCFSENEDKLQIIKKMLLTQSNWYPKEIKLNSIEAK